MASYISRRLLQTIPILLIISVIGFAIIYATGDPLAAYTVDSSLTGDDIARLKTKYGLDQPVPIQYLNWLKNLAIGDWGTSYYTREPTTTVIFETLPNTLILVAISYTITLILSIILGVYTALRQYSVFDHVTTAASFVGIAMPSFWFGLMLIIVFSVKFKEWGLPYTPVGGMFDFREGFSTGQLLWHTILPVATLSFVMMARYVRYIRASMLEQLKLEYVRTARAKGLSEVTVLFKHSFKNVLIPVITLIGLDIPSLLSGAIVVESIFAWPGMGRLFWNSAQNTDIPPLMGLLMFVAVLTVLSSLIADILYAAVDPRIRYS